jgi:hypothetical protein
VPKEICTTNLCTDYQEIWKKLFIERNGLTEDFFNKHIQINNTKTNDWQDGISYSIGYYVKVDWATTTYYIDQFVIKISKENILFPAINIPRDIYLSENHIKTILEADAFYSDMEKLSAAEKLKFKNTDAALKMLTSAAGVSKLCAGEIAINRETGNLELRSYAKYDGNQNECIYATIDLVTGKTTIINTPCYID